MTIQLPNITMLRSPLLSLSLAVTLWGMPSLIQSLPAAIAAETDPLLELTQRAHQQLEAGQFEAARDTYRQLLDRATREGSDRAMNDARLGQAKATLLAQHYTEAIPQWEQIVTHERQTPNHSGLPLALTNLALAQFGAGQYRAAEMALREAVIAWDSLRANLADLDQVTLFEQQAHTYRLLQKTLVAQGNTDAALVVAEASRAQSFVEQLVRKYRPTPAPPLDLAAIRAVAQRENTTLVVYSLVGDEVRVLGTETNEPTTLYSWVVSPQGAIAFQTLDLQAVGIESLRTFVRQTRTQLIDRFGRGRITTTLPGDDAADYLYQLLIAPIAAHLPRDPAASVTILPQDALFLVPFATLRNPAGNYLIESHTLQVAPNVQTLAIAAATPARSSQGTAVIVGNPTMPTLPQQDHPLSALPGAEQEAIAVANLLNTTPFLGSQASFAQIQPHLATASVLHFATHGLLSCVDTQIDPNESLRYELRCPNFPVDIYGNAIDPSLSTARDNNVFVNPGAVIVGGNVFVGGVAAETSLAREKVVRVDLPGALVLTADDEFATSDLKDGFLTSREIVALDLTADLVVLSACDTGQGRITGDGVVGLSRSFLAAGAASVVVSLWAIPDIPTAMLMTEFYRNLRHNPDKAAALRQAMLTTMEQYPDPINWGAFVFMGDRT
nr:CHAT domain-containing protein [Spirulina major]